MVLKHVPNPDCTQFLTRDLLHCHRYLQITDTIFQLLLAILLFDLDL